MNIIPISYLVPHGWFESLSAIAFASVLSDARLKRFYRYCPAFVSDVARILRFSELALRWPVLYAHLPHAERVGRIEPQHFLDHLGCLLGFAQANETGN
jgi:hypothetical protein